MPVWRKRLGRAVWVVAVLGALAWGVTLLNGGRDVGLYGQRWGVAILPAELGAVFVGVGSGWPSKDWMDRAHLRAMGDRLHGGMLEQAGLGVGCTGRRWNGNDPIVVMWCGILLPGWYCALIVMAPAVERPLRALAQAARRRRRRWRDPWGEGLCPGCGYDLRGRHDRCPECGLHVPAHSGLRPTPPPTERGTLDG